MKILTFKLVHPTAKALERVLTNINQMDGITATGKFITTIPRHNLVSATMEDDSVINAFELGRMVQLSDKDF